MKTVKWIGLSELTTVRVRRKGSGYACELPTGKLGDAVIDDPQTGVALRFSDIPVKILNVESSRNPFEMLSRLIAAFQKPDADIEIDFLIPSEDVPKSVNAA